MRVLWLIGKSSSRKKNYGGGGWIRSLASKLAKCDDIDLTCAFFYDEDIEPYSQEGYVKYPIYRHKSFIQKVKYNFLPEYRKQYEADYLPYLLEAVEKIQPELIQVFGSENICAPIIGNTNIPTILYIQGLLNPIYNSFYPVNMSDSAVRMMGFIKSEWLMNNGIVKRHEDLRNIAKREEELYKNARYVIGRTTFDYQLSRLYAPQSRYFRLNEMMRAPFYVDIPWKKSIRSKYYIFSTLSGVTYKGFDVILKAAKILTERNVNFEWRVAGLNESNKIVKLFEKFTNIHSDSVNVKYLGVLTEDQLKDVLLDSDVMVHPSYVDNSPNSVCEAQLLGLPVIACYVGGIPDFIENGKTGITVPLNAPYEIAFNIIQDIDKPFLLKCSKEARRIALERHNEDNIVYDAINIYKTILNENNRSTTNSI